MTACRPGLETTLSNVRADVLYQTTMFRDCVSALLRQGGARVRVHELSGATAGKIAAPAVVMETCREGVDWPGVAALLERGAGVSREATVVIVASLIEDEARVISSRRVRCADAVALLGELESWLR